VRPLLLALLASIPLALPASAAAHVEVHVGAADQIVVDATGPHQTADEDIALSASADVVTVTQRAADGTLTARTPCVAVSPAAVTCPRASDTEARAYMGDGDDLVHAEGLPFRVEIYGGAGDDRITAGDLDDLLHGGAGSDTLDAGPGDDVLDTADRQADAALTCGAGEDRLDDDLVDPVSDCEIVAPEWGVQPALSAGPYEVGRTVTAGDWTVVAEGPTSATVRWLSCGERPSGGIHCNSVSQAHEYVITSEDIGRYVYAELQSSNRAGSIDIETASTGTIPRPRAATPAPLPGRRRTPTPLAPPSGPLAPKETAAQRTARARAAIATALRPVVADLAGRDLARLGGRIRHRITLPSAGQMTVRWFVPAATARRLGVRPSRGAARVLVAEGRVRGAAGRPVAIDVRPTRAGRAILHRARTLRLTLAAELAGARGEADVTLRRRR
jgi:hypothetical protein